MTPDKLEAVLESMRPGLARLGDRSPAPYNEIEKSFREFLLEHGDAQRAYSTVVAQYDPSTRGQSLGALRVSVDSSPIPRDRQTIIFFSDKLSIDERTIAVRSLAELEQYFTRQSREWEMANTIFARSSEIMVEVWGWAEKSQDAEFDRVGRVIRAMADWTPEARSMLAREIANRYRADGVTAEKKSDGTAALWRHEGKKFEIGDDPARLRDLAAELEAEGFHATAGRLLTVADRIDALKRWREEKSRAPEPLPPPEFPVRREDWFMEWSSVPSHAGEQPSASRPGECFILGVNSEGRCLFAVRKDSR